MIKCNYFITFSPTRCYDPPPLYPWHSYPDFRSHMGTISTVCSQRQLQPIRMRVTKHMFLGSCRLRHEGLSKKLQNIFVDV